MRSRYSVALISSFGLHALFVLALIYTWHTKDLPEDLPTIPVSIIADYEGEPFPNPTPSNDANTPAAAPQESVAAQEAAPKSEAVTAASAQVTAQPEAPPEPHSRSEPSPITKLIEKLEQKPPTPTITKPTVTKPAVTTPAKPQPTPIPAPQKPIAKPQPTQQTKPQDKILAKQPPQQVQQKVQQNTAPAPATKTPAKPATQPATKAASPAATKSNGSSNGSLSSQFDLSAAMKSSSGVNANGREAPALGSSTSKAGNGGGELSMDLQTKLRSQLKSCWAMPADLSNSASLIVKVQIELKPDGNLARAAKLISPNKIGATTQQQIAIDNALSAVRNCAPFDLPVGRYEEWKNFTFRFVPK